MDQYSQYNNLSKLLQRFSFNEKMAVAAVHSSQAILFNQKMQQNQYTGILPWCLETFVMLSIEATEYSNKDFRSKNENKFVKMCNAILEATVIASDTICDKFSFLDMFMPVTGLTQFYIQEYYMIRQYRYWTIFNDDSQPVCLKTVFEEKMGTKYEDYLILGNVLQLLSIIHAEYKSEPIPKNVLNYLLYERFPEAASHLKISRSDYVELQKQYAGNSEDPYKYVYSLRPSYRFSFIEERNTIYCPLPHLLNENITSALFYRITDGDNTLRDMIGKNIWEKYLLKIIEESNIYDEVYPEQSYQNNGSIAKSPDVLVRQGDEVLFIDSKSTVPNIGIRLLNAKSHEKHINIVAQNIVKLYNQIQKLSYYNPFIGLTSDCAENHWGIVVVLEDSYIRRNHYFKKAAEMLGMEIHSPEYEWISRHIKVISLYEIERITFSCCSLLDACKQASENDPFGYTFAKIPLQDNNLINSCFDTFRTMIRQKTLLLVDEIKTRDILI